jgi:RimJ/RimL family protein N-acetyltransferase
MRDLNQLATTRLILSPISTEDEGYFLTYSLEPNHLFYEKVSVPALKVWIYKAYEHWYKHSYGVWTIRLKEDGQFIGFCSLRFDEQDKETILSYGILIPYRKQGYAFEAVSAIIQYGFPHCSLRHLIAGVKQDNLASIQLLEKLGFHQLNASPTSYTYTKESLPEEPVLMNSDG